MKLYGIFNAEERLVLNKVFAAETHAREFLRELVKIETEASALDLEIRAIELEDPDALF